MFFFFKQKPAYEMRISDWSSDGCSSDLPRRSSPVRTAWQSTASASSDVSSSIIAASRSSTNMIPKGAAQVYEQPIAILPIVEEIGRSSCRERVCQYV